MHKAHLLTPLVSETAANEIAAWSALGTALFTAGLFLTAIAAWWTTRGAVKAAREANEQAKADSIARTRPYVLAELVPGLAGRRTWDLRVSNAGQTVARDLTFSYNLWPDDPDDVAQAAKACLVRPRTLPPGSSMRVMWRLEGNFDDGTTEAGMPRVDGVVTAHYTSDDPSKPHYEDSYDIIFDDSLTWPAPEEGPRPDGVPIELRPFYRLGQTLVRRVGELGR